jgi:hypothetical protein
MIAVAEIYLSIGGVIWLLLDGLGIVSESHVQRVASGKPIDMLGIVVHTVELVAFWPLYVWIWLRGLFA